jgi:hypothetical protein
MMASIDYDDDDDDSVDEDGGGPLYTFPFVYLQGIASSHGGHRGD